MPAIPDQLQQLNDVAAPSAGNVGQSLYVASFSGGQASYGYTTIAPSSLDGVLAVGNTSSRNMSVGAFNAASATIAGSGTFGGYLTANLGASITGSMGVSGLVNSTGSGAGYSFNDRSNGGNGYIWYSTGGPAYLYNNAHGNIASFTSQGVASFSPRVTVNGAVDDGSTALQVNGNASVSGNLSLAGGEIFSNSSLNIQDSQSIGTNTASIVWLSNVIGYAASIASSYTGASGNGLIVATVDNNARILTLKSGNDVFYITGSKFITNVPATFNAGVISSSLNVSGGTTLNSSAGALNYNVSSSAPTNTTTPVGWVSVTVAGVVYKTPLYQ